MIAVIWRLPARTGVNPHEPRLARVAAAIADATRSRMLAYLLDGQHATAGELARAAGVQPSTASAHLDKLSSAGLTVCESRGRHLNGWFATLNVKRQDATMVVLHRGARVRDNSTAGVRIDDPCGLLQWAAKERALVRFGSAAEFSAKKSAFTAIVRHWIAEVA